MFASSTHEHNPEHDPALQEFLRWKSNPHVLRLGCRGSDNTPDVNYIPEVALADWLTIDRIKLLLQGLFKNTEEFAVSAEYVKRHYLRPFAILLSAGFGPMIRYFVERPSLQDHFLPYSVKPREFPESTSCDLFEAFNRQQWQFCPVKLEYDMSHFLENDYVLPITHKEEIRNGGSAFLYKIIVDESYNSLVPSKDTDTPGTRPKSNTFALKTYYQTSEAKTYFENERNAFKKLRYHNKPPDNIIGYYGSFVRDGTYNIILEYADRGTLNDYMKNTHEPTSGSSILALWTRCLGLMRGLGQIHNTPGSTSDGPRILLGLTKARSWHHDLNPDNILVVSRGGDSPYDCDFKVADLGLAHFIWYLSSMQDATDEDQHGSNAYSGDISFLLSPFRPELILQGAPESYRGINLEKSRLQVLQNVDIWSMGCIFSEVATWVIEGYPKVLEYRRRRRIEVQRKGGIDEELFHWDWKILESVTGILDEIVGNSRPTDHVTARVVQRMVKWMLMEEAHSRTGANQLVEQSNRILAEAREKLHPRVTNHTVSDGILSPDRRMPPNLPPGHGSHSLVHGFETGVSSTSQGWLGSSETLSAFRERSLGSSLPDSSLIGTSERMRRVHDEDTNDNLPSNFTGGQFHDLAFPPRRIMSTPRHPNSHSQPLTGPMAAAAGMIAPRASSSQEHPLHLVQRMKHNPDTSNILSRPQGSPQSPDVPRQPVIESPTTVEIPHLSELRGFDPSMPNHMVTSESTSSRIEPNGEFSVSHSPAQNERPHPYMSVDDGLHIKRSKDQGRYAKYPDEALIRTMDPILMDRDHAFLVDNSESMKPHNENVKRVLELLSSLTKHYDPNGLDLYFTTDYKKYKPSSNKKVLKIFDEHPPYGLPDMRARFAAIIEPYQARFGKRNTLSRLVHPSSTPSRGPRRLSLYVLTDGVWDPDCNLITEIRALVASLQREDMANKYIGIQFIRFGADDVGKKRLETLDSELALELDVIDTTPADGNVWKMLFGAVNDWFDGDRMHYLESRDQSWY
ncbi:MAG: hypothetical protein Q9166_006440 [cf. Caloplaca sp. 2 TL-2023]